MSSDLASLAQIQEQTETIRDAASRLLAAEWSVARLREQVASSARAHADALWTRLRELDWHRVLARDAATGMPELCAMAEEIGRALAPVPLGAAVVGRRLLESMTGEPDDGLTVLATREPGLTTDPLAPRALATRTETGFRLDGTKLFVPWGDSADRWIVSARVQAESGLGLFSVASTQPGVVRTELTSLDWWPLAELRFENVEIRASDALALGADGAALLADALDHETLASCAELVGVASGAHELAVDYAKQRIAFDRPIGAFQAVKHRLVNLRADIEIARALVTAAAQSLAQGVGAPSVAVARAAFWCADTLRRVPEGALQVFGGIGYTWEHDLHLYLRRAATLTSLLGARATHRERIARQLETGA